MTPEQAVALRAPFPPRQVGKLPKAGITLDYVGHAAVTDRLLQVDPEWSWEPFALAADGSPLILFGTNDAWLWVRLTVCGVTRVGCGTAPKGAFELPKQLISDAIRNASMRFGVALDLWAKEDLHAGEAEVPPTPKSLEPAEPLPEGWLSREVMKEAHLRVAREVKALPKAQGAAFAQWKLAEGIEGWPLPKSMFERLDAQVRALSAESEEPF